EASSARTELRNRFSVEGKMSMDSLDDDYGGSIPDEESVSNKSSNWIGKAIGKVFARYFESILGNASCMREPIDDEVVGHGSVLTIQQQRGLVARFSEIDVRRALGTIQGDKSPGMDGYNSTFSSMRRRLSVRTRVKLFLISSNMVVTERGQCHWLRIRFPNMSSHRSS
ncbi:hypothetical protein Dimus_037296, partial [Dionaea muscipula]